MVRRSLRAILRTVHAVVRARQCIGARLLAVTPQELAVFDAMQTLKRQADDKFETRRRLLQQIWRSR